MASLSWNRALCVLVLAVFMAIASATSARSVLTHRAHPRDSVPDHFTHLGRAQADDSIHFTIHLKQRNLDKLNDIFWKVSDPKSPFYGKHLTQQEVVELVAPEKAARQQVTEWIASHLSTLKMEGKANYEHVGFVLDGGDHIKVNMAAHVVESLFQTEIHHYVSTKYGKQHRQVSHVGSMSVPEHLTQHIDFVTGITLLHTYRKYGKQAQEGVIASQPAGGSPNAYNGLSPTNVILPSTLHQMYNIPNDAASTNPANVQCIAAFISDYFSSQALTNFHYLGGTPQPVVTTVGQPSCFGTGGCQDQMESDLDMQYITSTGRGAPTWFWSTAPSSWVLEFAQSVLGTNNAPWVFSISYGGGEAGNAMNGLTWQQYIDRANTALQMIGATGRTVLASAGDNGATGDNTVDLPIGPTQVCTPYGGGNCANVPSGFVNATNPTQLNCACTQMLVTASNPVLGTQKVLVPTISPFSIPIAAAALNIVISSANVTSMFNAFYQANGFNTWTGTDSKGNFQFCSNVTCPVLNSITWNGAKSAIDGSAVTITISGRPSTVSIPFSPSFPASSPYVTAVGATQLSSTPNSLCTAALQWAGSSTPCIGEVVASTANSPPSLIVSGGGFSLYYPQPDYQRFAVAHYLNSTTAKNTFPPAAYQNTSMRAYPDVSFNGHNYLVMMSNANTNTCPCSAVPVDGTSCSSPAFAGLVTLMNEALLRERRPTLGFLNPLLYRMRFEHPAAFTDIVAGNNMCTESYCFSAGYSAAEGWDPVSGLGVPNFAEMYEYIVVRGAEQDLFTVFQNIFSGLSDSVSKGTFSDSKSSIWTAIGFLFALMTISLMVQVSSWIGSRRNKNRSRGMMDGSELSTSPYGRMQE